MSRILSGLLLLSLNTFAVASSISIDQTVSGIDNLYYTSWGHWYTLPADDALANPYSHPASVVSSGGLAFDFSSYSSLTISATGSVVADGPNAVGPNGDTCNPTCLFHDGNFRGLTAYSLVGIWSSTADVITPFGDPHTAPFFVGSSALLNIPSLSSSYLFLAENDGYFADNSGSFNVHLTATSAVPVPAALPLFASALLGMGMIRRRKDAI